MISLLLLTLAVNASTNVLGFDLGSAFFKLSYDNTVIENLTSQRKTETTITLTPESTLYATESANSKHPTYNTLLADLHLLKEREDGYFEEELLGMVISYGLELAELRYPDLLTTDLSVVMTVPSYYDTVHRKMLTDAARLAGLTTVTLVNENIAAALTHTPSTDDEVVLFYNMGATDTEVTVVRFWQGYVDILAETYVADLGGNNFLEVLMHMLVPNYEDTLDPKNQAILRREAT